MRPGGSGAWVMANFQSYAQSYTVRGHGAYAVLYINHRLIFQRRAKDRVKIGVYAKRLDIRVAAVELFSWDNVAESLQLY